MKPTVCPLQCSVPRTADIEKILDIPQFKSPQDWSIQTQHFLLIVATDFFAWLPRSANRSFENHRAILYSVQWYYTHASQYINAVQCNSLVRICLCDGFAKSVCQCKWFARKTISDSELEVAPLRYLSDGMERWSLTTTTTPGHKKER